MKTSMDIKKWNRKRRRILEIIEVGSDLDLPSRVYDFINAGAIIINLIVSVMYTFSEVREVFSFLLVLIEQITVVFFAVDYILRILTAGELYDELTEVNAIKKYAFSFTGIIDLLSFLPYFLPVFVPAGTVAFRMVRIVRIFRLFRVNAYYDSLNVITEVIAGKKQQLISSVFIILVLMLASSLSMYGLEHEAQPEVFENAFSGIWWAASTLLTVGYGDIYPITDAGKFLGIIITFLGVGMVAIPTGIISAGFVDQYSTIKKRTEYGYESDMNFIKIKLKENDNWVGKRIADLNLPEGVIIAIIKRKEEAIIPRGNIVLQEKDSIVLGALPFGEHEKINLKEIVLKEHNPWTGMRIRDLDISRHAVIVLVKRRNKALIPNGNMILAEGDRVFVYTQQHLLDVNVIEL